MTEIKVAKLKQLSEGCGIQVEVDGQSIALFRLHGKVYALDGTCPHKGGPLGEGEIDGAYVSCPWHGWQFDVATGQCHGRATKSVVSYPVRVDSEFVYIDK